MPDSAFCGLEQSYAIATRQSFPIKPVLTMNEAPGDYFLSRKASISLGC